MHTTSSEQTTFLVQLNLSYCIF
ncbi:unnamed protein product, partial [Rotaria magnacalcarata]